MSDLVQFVYFDCDTPAARGAADELEGALRAAAGDWDRVMPWALLRAQGGWPQHGVAASVMSDLEASGRHAGWSAHRGQITPDGAAPFGFPGSVPFGWLEYDGAGVKLTFVPSTDDSQGDFMVYPLAHFEAMMLDLGLER